MVRCLALWLGLWAGVGFAAGPPNILFLFSDDQSYKTVSCYPEALPGAHTPNIDALAQRGIRFTHSYLGSWCMPSRASLLTGRHPHGIESMRMEGTYPGSTYDPAVCRFWPNTFREQGYVTAQIGKWHTGVDAGFGRDWDYQAVWNRPAHPDNAGAYYDNQLIMENGVERRVEGYSTDNYSTWASDFIKGAHRDPTKPWYLWLCYGAIHGPTTPAERHKGMHAKDPVRIPEDITGPRPGKPTWLDKTQAWIRGDDGVIYAKKSGEAFGDIKEGSRLSYDQFVHQSLDCVEALDEGIGQVLAALQESGQADNTLIVFSADQGFGMGEHGFRSKLAPWDATYRSPLIVSMPSRLPQGKVCRQPVHGVDLVSTFFAFAGIAEPWSMHGRDLSSLLQDPEREGPMLPCFYEHTGRSYGSDVAKTLQEKPETAEHSHVPWYVALNDGRWKYIRYLNGGAEELYDLEKDPEELRNLALEQTAELERLRGVLAGELNRTGSPFP